MTKDKLAAQANAAAVGRRVISELKQLERQLADAGLMPGDKDLAQSQLTHKL
jgi:hypothetical protein